MNSLLTSRRFYPLFITQFGGAFTDNAFKNAFLIYYTYDLANAQSIPAASMVAIASAAFIAPFFLLSAVAGTLADSREKSRLSQRIKLVEIGLMTAAAIAFALQHVVGLLCILACMGAQSAFFGPVKYSMLPQHLRNDELVSGNGWIEGGTFIAILLGTMVGGLVIRMDAGILLISAILIISACCGYLASRLIPNAPPSQPALTLRWNIVSATKSVITQARSNRVVWGAILGISWFWFVGAIIMTQLPTYTKDIIGGDEKMVTLFLTLFSVGIAAGSILCSACMRGAIHARYVPFGMIGMSMAMALFVATSYGYANVTAALPENGIVTIAAFFSSTPYSAGIAVSLLLLAAFGGVYTVPLYTIMQHCADASSVSRTIAANNIMNACFMVAASLSMLALLAAGTSLLTIFALLATACAACTPLVIRYATRGIHHA